MIRAEPKLRRHSSRGRTRVLRLGDERTRDPAVAGVKAAALAELVRAGFPVPPGVVIPAGARDFLSSLLAWYDSLGPAESVAVRVSPVSGAVPFPARVGVRGIRDLLVAVRDALRAGGPTGESPPLLLQPVLTADASGVLRPEAPIEDATDRHLVLAVPGRSPRDADSTVETIVLDAGSGRTIFGPSGPSSLLPPSERRRLSALATRVEQVLGGPREVEWAIRGRAILILSARVPTGTRPAPPARPSPFDRSFDEALRTARERVADLAPRPAPLRVLRAFVSGPADVRAFRLRTVPAHRRRVAGLELEVSRVLTVAQAAALLREITDACLEFEAESHRVSGRAGRGPQALRRAAAVLLHHPALARERRTFRSARDHLRERSTWLVRLGLASLGEQLARAGILASAGDVGLLTLSEACGADRPGFADRARERILARRAEAIVARLPGMEASAPAARRGAG